MKIGRKMALIITALVIGLLASCASTEGGGGFLSLEKGEKVLGTIETTFVFPLNSAQVYSGEYDTDAINAQAYEELLEVAQEQYLSSGQRIDIRDIVVEVKVDPEYPWRGDTEELQNTECYAHGKVIEAHQ